MSHCMFVQSEAPLSQRHGFCERIDAGHLCLVLQQQQGLILCTSEATGGLFLTWNVLLNSFLTYINDMVRVLAPYCVLPGVTGGPLTPSVKHTVRLHDPLPTEVFKGSVPKGNPERLRMGMLKQLAATLRRRD